MQQRAHLLAKQGLAESRGQRMMLARYAMLDYGMGFSLESYAAVDHAHRLRWVG